MPKLQTSRAYAMAESWAKNPERLSALLYENMTTEDWDRICESIAKQIVAIADNSPHEQCLRSLLVEANVISGIVIESVFLPIAEGMAAQDAAEDFASAGFDQAKARREDAMVSACAQYEGAVRIEAMQRRSAA